MAKERREVFFGLIAPIGVNLDAVEKALGQSLARVNYQTNNVRVTTLFDEIKGKYKISPEDEIDRYRKLIEAGDNLCRDTKRNDILALYAIECLKRYSP